MNNKKKRDPVSTRNQILEVAFLEVYAHSFKGTSTNTIIDKLDLTRGAFFHHFPTKEDLGLALIDEIHRGLILQRWIEPIEKYEDPIKGILKNFKLLIEDHAEDNLLKGCPLNNMIQEMSDIPKFQKILFDVMEMWITETVKVLTKAKKNNFLKTSVNTRELAEFIVANQEAAFAMGKALNSKKAMKSIYKSLKRYISSINKI